MTTLRTTSLKFVIALCLMGMCLVALAEDPLNEDETPAVIPYFADEMNEEDKNNSAHRRQEIILEHDKQLTKIDAEQKDRREDMIKHHRMMMNDRVMKNGKMSHEMKKNHEAILIKQLVSQTKLQNEPTHNFMSPRSRMINDPSHEETTNPFEPPTP